MRDIDEIVCFLSVTATLVTMLADKYLHADSASVKSRETLNALIGHSAAYNFLRDYEYITDCVDIVGDRLREAIKALDGAAGRDAVPI